VTCQNNIIHWFLLIILISRETIFLINKISIMTIQFNTDNNIKGSEKLRAPLIALISEELDRYSHQITRVEVHLSDENGPKEGQNDKRCTIEARLEGLKPIAVTNHANTHEQAVEGAVEKLKASLETLIGRLRNH
jgi:ribosome-associated translation inhibitor RaiA